MSDSTKTLARRIDAGAGYGLARVESILRQHVSAAADMDEESAAAYRRSILAATPFAPAVASILGGDDPAQAFAGLLSATDLSELTSSERVLLTLLALAHDWEAAREDVRAASLLGLLVRAGIAVGHENLVAQAAERLAIVTARRPEAAGVSMPAEDAQKIHRAWRQWGSSRQTRCPETLQRLAVIVQEAENCAVQGQLAEFAVWERLLASGGDTLEPGQRRRTLARMLDLCARANVCRLAFSVRGAGLLAPWASAAVGGAQAAPMNLRTVLVQARQFESVMTAHGVSSARRMMATSLEGTHREIVRRWPSLPAVWECALMIARLRRATIEQIDATAYERLVALLRTTARFAAGELATQLRVECMEIVALWISTGDEVGAATARRMIQGCAPQGDPRELLARASLHLNLGTGEHGDMHLRSAHHLARMAFAQLADNRGWERGRAALFAALAGLRLSELDGAFHLGDDARRLRQVALDLVERARESARQSECILLGRILLTLARLRLREALRRTGAPRRVLVGQATHDADHAEKLFRLARVGPRALEAQWLKARILAADSGPHSDRIGAGLRQVRAALEDLGEGGSASGFVGDHTWGLPLGHCMCHDYVQFLNAALIPGAIGDNLQRPPSRDFQDLRHIDSGTWLRYLLRPLETSASAPRSSAVFSSAIAA